MIILLCDLIRTLSRVKVTLLEMPEKVPIYSECDHNKRDRITTLLMHVATIDYTGNRHVNHLAMIRNTERCANLRNGQYLTLAK